MKGSFQLLRMGGIRLYLHWTFLLLVGWVILVNVQYGSGPEQLIWSIGLLAAVFACVALHELGHALVAARYGIRARNIVLLPIGGIASIEKFPDNPRQELMISLAGPLVNIIIALLLWLPLRPQPSFWALPDQAPAMSIRTFLFDLRMMNIGLAAFNLIPAFPMDGGRILRALLGFRLNYVRATTIAAIIGKIIAAAFIGIGIILVNPILPIIGLFIILSAGTEEYYLRLKSLVKDIRLNEVLMYDYNGLQADMIVQDAANILMSNHSKYFVLMDGAGPVGTINRLEIVKAMAEKRYQEPLRRLVKEAVECLEGSKEVATVLEQLAHDDERLYPVMDNGRFAGVVNLNHIIEYLLLHKADTGDYPRLRSLTGLLQ